MARMEKSSSIMSHKGDWKNRICVTQKKRLKETWIASNVFYSIWKNILMGDFQWAETGLKGCSKEARTTAVKDLIGKIWIWTTYEIMLIYQYWISLIWSLYFGYVRECPCSWTFKYLGEKKLDICNPFLNGSGKENTIENLSKDGKHRK